VWDESTRVPAYAPCAVKSAKDKSA